MEETITIPVMIEKDYEDITPFGVCKYKKGDIFEYESENIIHIALYEHGIFSHIPKEKCEFINNFIGLNLAGKVYGIDEKIDTSKLTQEVLDRLVSIGYVKKIVKQKPENKTKTVKKTVKKVSGKKYSEIAKKLNLTNNKFKILCKKILNKDIKDMRKRVSNPMVKKIIEALS